MKTRYINILLGIIVSGSILSCDNYLDKEQSKTSSIVPKSTEHLEELLNNYSMFSIERNRTAVYSTDDYGVIPDIHTAKTSIYRADVIQFATWDIEYIPKDTKEKFWGGEYSKIFTANMILYYLPKVTGSSEVKMTLEAEAHFIRAYSYWQLANTYCLPWCEENKAELGLPLKESTSFEESMKRSTLQATYDFIASDLNEAMKITTSLEKNGKNKIWRASKPAVNAFAARFWLHRGEYAKAQQYAEAALTDYDVLVDYNSEMSFSAKKDEYTINQGKPNEERIHVEYPITKQEGMDGELGWKEFYYFRVLKDPYQWYIPSQELLDLYDKQNDLRYKYHIVSNFSYNRGVRNLPGGYPGYIFFYIDDIPSGPTVAEMILIKSECQARLGNYQEAMETLNILRAHRIDKNAGEAVIKMKASSQTDAIAKILKERRCELPFSQRWFDIRRFNNNDDPNDDVSLQRTFYPYNSTAILDKEPMQNYSLSKKSRRFAAPIITSEIESSEYAIEQNKY